MCTYFPVFYCSRHVRSEYSNCHSILNVNCYFSLIVACCFVSPQRPGMTSGARMPHQGAPMGPPGPPYGGTPPIRPGIPNTTVDPNRKRPTTTPPVQAPSVQSRARKWVPCTAESIKCNVSRLLALNKENHLFLNSPKSYHQIWCRLCPDMKTARALVVSWQRSQFWDECSLIW